MELLHTFEEIHYFDRLKDLQLELEKLGQKYNNSEVLDLSFRYGLKIKSELEKYNSYIGKECQAPPSSFSESKDYRDGKIEGNFYFNAYSRSIRCDFKYSSGGFDTHAIKDLKE